MNTQQLLNGLGVMLILTGTYILAHILEQMLWPNTENDDESNNS